MMRRHRTTKRHNTTIYVLYSVNRNGSNYEIYITRFNFGIVAKTYFLGLWGQDFQSKSTRNNIVGKKIRYINRRTFLTTFITKTYNFENFFFRNVQSPTWYNKPQVFRKHEIASKRIVRISYGSSPFVSKRPIPPPRNNCIR